MSVNLLAPKSVTEFLKEIDWKPYTGEFKLEDPKLKPLGRRLVRESGPHHLEKNWGRRQLHRK